MAGKGASTITLALDERWMKRKAEGSLPEREHANFDYRFSHDGSKEDAVKLAVALAYKGAARVGGHLVTDKYIYLTTPVELEDLLGIVDEVQGKARKRAKSRQVAQSAPPRMSPGRHSGFTRSHLRL